MATKTGYQRVKKWRDKAKNRKYSAEFMKFQRRYYRKLSREGLITYEAIPKAYRYWKKPATNAAKKLPRADI